MAFANNNAVVLFGAQNSRNLTVSKELEELGVHLLKSAPSELKVTALPLRTQPRYGFYIGNLSAYLKSWVENTVVDGTATGFPVRIPMSYTFDIIPPALVMGWRIPIADEVKDDIIKNHGATTILSQGGKPGLSVQKATIASYANLGEYRPDPVFPTINDHFNFGCLPQMAFSSRIISTLVRLHHYPAWHDDDHMENYFEDVEGEGKGKGKASSTREREYVS